MSAVNAITGNEYSGHNAATLSTGTWATFAQWRSVGKMVRKGEKGTAIMNRIAVDEDGNRRFTGYSYVFNSAQVSDIERKNEEEEAPDAPEVAPKVTKKVGKAQLRKVASQMSHSYRLMHIKYHDEDWSTDGYSAINQLVQPTRKTCELQVKPDIQLSKIVDGHDEYEADNKVVITDGISTLTSKHVKELQVKVNEQWFANLCHLYPNATVKLTSRLTPVLFKEQGKLVAVLMPVKN